MRQHQGQGCSCNSRSPDWLKSGKWAWQWRREVKIYIKRLLPGASLYGAWKYMPRTHIYSTNQPTCDQGLPWVGNAGFGAVDRRYWPDLATFPLFFGLFFPSGYANKPSGHQLEGGIFEGRFQTYSVFGWICEIATSNISKTSWRHLQNFANLKVP